MAVWRHFTTQTALRDHVQALIAGREFMTPFKSELISSLIAERHYFCAYNNLRPCLFRKLPGGNPYIFEGYFPNGLGWHPVSWAKCIKGPQGQARAIITQAMRDTVASELRAVRAKFILCEDCGLEPPKEVHHLHPTFREIANAVFASSTEDDVRECLATWDWFSKTRFILSEDTRIGQMFKTQHARAVVQALCRPCHLKHSKSRP